MTNSHEIRIVVREMAAITSGRRKQGLPLPSSTQSAKGAHFAALQEFLPYLPTSVGTKTKCSPFQLLCCTDMVPYWT